MTLFEMGAIGEIKQDIEPRKPASKEPAVSKVP